MSKMSFKSKEAVAATTVVACGIAVPALFYVLSVLNYKVPANNCEDLRNQHIKVENAEIHYSYTIEETVSQARDSLERNKTYTELYELEEVGYNETNNKTYADLSFRANIIEGNTINDYLQNSNEVNQANANLNAAYKSLKSMQRDSIVRDSILRIPLVQRFNTNRLQMRLDKNIAAKARAEQNILLLQKSYKTLNKKARKGFSLCRL